MADSTQAVASEGAPAAASPKPQTRGCKHYSRGCTLRAPCCGELFSCRLCHDELKSHCMDRHAVRSVVCTRCGLEQPPAASCSGCGESFGAYFCPTCNLFDDDLSKGQFHCDKCGICRVGGRDNFFHCETCGACYSVELRDNHVCVPNAMGSDCPICCEYLFDSLDTPQVLRCGHTMHRKCLELHFSHGGYTCPLCNVSVCDMAAAWEYLDEEIRHTPMPDDFAGREVELLCNDCHTPGRTAFHALGLKCPQCGSYNTRRS